MQSMQEFDHLAFSPRFGALAFAPRTRRAFSLVELLTAIGIIGILIALLLPALEKVREQSNQVKCMANLRSIGQAAMMHATEHNNYLPTAGWQWNCINGTTDPAGLQDPSEKKYMYYLDSGTKRPMPVTTALAWYMGVRVRTDSREPPGRRHGQGQPPAALPLPVAADRIPGLDAAR